MYDFLEATDIGGQIPPSFATQMESKKWTDRKEALEVIEKITAVPKIRNSDFSELVRILKRTISKDSNIVVATLAAKCMCQLAKALRTGYSPYALSSLSILFEKFKEKKPNVNSVIRDAADAVFLGTNLEDAFEDILKFLDNKNPQIKSEVALFLARVFSHFPTQVPNKKILRPLINALIKTLSDMDATVRDSSAMAIGTAMKVTGESIMMPIIADVEALKIAKIKEFYEKAEIITAQANGQNHEMHAGITNGGQNDVAATNGIVDDGADEEEDAYEFLEAVDISGQIPPSFATQMESKKWTERKEALEVIEKVTSVPKIKNSDFSELVRILKRTISKDSNIVVATLAAKCMCQLAKALRTGYSPYALSSLSILFEKFKEKKPNVNSVIRDAADAVFLGTNLEDALEDILKFLDNKNPQIKSEVALFLSRAFSNYPLQLRNKKILRPLINALIKTLSDMDAGVRDSSAMAIGTAMKAIGESIMAPIIADVEALKVTKIKEFYDKATVKKVHPSLMQETAPAPAPQQVQMPSPAVRSSATMIRSTSKKSLPKVVGGPMKPPTSVVPNSTATVKRTATIIKRPNATSNKRVSSLPQPPSMMQAPAPVSASMPAPAPTPAPAPAPAFASPQTPVMPTFTARPTPKLDNFDTIVFRLISDNQNEVNESLDVIENSLTDNNEFAYKNLVNQIVDLCCVQLIKSHVGPNLNRIRRVTDCMIKLFSRPQLASTASPLTIRFLLVQIFSLTQIINQTENTVVLESLDCLSSAVMDSVEPSTMMSILTGLLNDPSPTSIIEQIKTAIIRSMRSFK